MGEAVQHRPPLGQTGHCQPVVLLVQKKAGFLPILKVHGIHDAVFHDVHVGALRRRLTGQGIPSFVLLHALQTADGHIVALVDAADVLSVLPQHLDQQREQPVLDALHAHTQRLGHQHAFEPVHRQTREQVGFAEDHAAAPAVRLAHHHLAVVPGVADAPLPEGIGEVIVGIAAHQPHPDLGAAVVEPAAQPAAAAAHHVHQRAVLRPAVHGGDLPLVDPGVPAGQRGLALGRDGDLSVGTWSFHGTYRLSFRAPMITHLRRHFHIFIVQQKGKGNDHAQHLSQSIHAGI